MDSTEWGPLTFIPEAPFFLGGMGSVACRNDNDKHDNSWKPPVDSKLTMTLGVLREGEAILHLVPPILDHLFMQ